MYFVMLAQMFVCNFIKLHDTKNTFRPFQSGVYSYGSVREAMRSIYTKEGARGLTCGLIPTLLRDAPFSGLYLMFYTQTKKRVPQSKYRNTLVCLDCYACSCNCVLNIVLNCFAYFR